jgi:hypothetical protein
MAGLIVLFAGAVAASKSWSFQTFFDGDWDLERVRGDEVMRARYSLRPVGGKLEGAYFEYEDGRQVDDESARSNVLQVQVDFLDGEGRTGSFNLAKAAAGEPAQAPDFQAVFDFDFGERHAGAMWFSESKWLGSRGGLIQFAVVGPDAFALTHATADTEQSPAALKVTSWSATRASGSRAASASPKRSLLLRWGWYLAAAIALLAYRTAKSKQA